MSKAKISKLANKKPHELTEADYNARSDAYTLARAIEIKDDKKRHTNAKLWAAVLVIQETNERDALEKAANDA